MHPAFERNNPPFERVKCPDGGIGRRAGLKHLWSQGRAGSTPALGTEEKLQIILKLFYFSTMASVYILYSEQLNRYYIGSCKDLSYRIDQHLSKEFTKSFTTVADDWKLYLSIDELGYQQARSIELHLKKMKSKTYIENLIKYPEIIERLKLKHQ